MADASDDDEGLFFCPYAAKRAQDAAEAAAKAAAETEGVGASGFDEVQASDPSPKKAKTSPQRVSLLSCKVARPRFALISKDEKHDAHHLLLALERGGVVKINADQYRMPDPQLLVKAWPDDDEGMDPVADIMKDLVGANGREKMCILDHNGEWIDRFGTPLSEEECQARDMLYASDESRPVIARGCNVTGTGKGKNRIVNDVKAKGCFYLVPYKYCHAKQVRYNKLNGTRVSSKPEIKRYGATKFDPTLVQLEKDCPTLAEALTLVAKARGVPDVMLHNSNTALVLYLPGVGDSKQEHRDSRAGLVIKYNSDDFAYVSKLVTEYGRRFGLGWTDGSQRLEEIKVSGKHRAVFNSQVANTTHTHMVKSNAASKEVSMTVAFFLARGEDKAISDPTMAQLFRDADYQPARPGLVSTQPFGAHRFEVVSSASVIKPVEKALAAAEGAVVVEEEVYDMRPTVEVTGETKKSRFCGVTYVRPNAQTPIYTASNPPPGDGPFIECSKGCGRLFGTDAGGKSGSVHHAKKCRGTAGSSNKTWSGQVGYRESRGNVSVSRSFYDEIDAAKWVDEEYRKRGLPVPNFPRLGDRRMMPKASQYYGISKIWGVFGVGDQYKWQARISCKVSGRQVHIGIFDDEVDAARAVDDELVRQGEAPRNFAETADDALDEGVSEAATLGVF